MTSLPQPITPEQSEELLRAVAKTMADVESACAVFIAALTPGFLAIAARLAELQQAINTAYPPTTHEDPS